MDIVVERAMHDGPAGLVVGAEEQTSGRGRRGREWSSPPGAGLYFSWLLRPPRAGAGESPSTPSVASFITLAAGVAVAGAIAAETGLTLALKWPNDVLIGRRKLAGILAEGLAVGTVAEAVVLGVGLNVMDVVLPPAIAGRATSIGAELGRTVDRGTLLARVLAGLVGQYQRLLEGRYDEVLADWRRLSPSAVGAAIEWDGPGGVVSGVTAGVDGLGALLVRTAGGTERIIAGELRWL